MTPAIRILIAEDDPSIRIGLQELLTGEGYDVTVSSHGDQALALAEQGGHDLLLLDVMLPKLSGYDLCRKLRQKGSRLPVLMLTAKGTEIDKVVGLELGADDYVTKPFGVRELLARIQALLRRAQPAPSPSQSQAPDPDAAFRIGDAVILPRRFELQRDGTTCELTARELALLRLFAAHPGEVLSRERLLAEVWGQKYLGTTRTLDQVIVQLRRKLGEPADAPRWLLTVHGVGYRLAEATTQSSP